MDVPAFLPRPLWVNQNAMLDARIIAKTTLPDLARAITRPRLLQRVAAAVGARVILITGQAAQGKSTLAKLISERLKPLHGTETRASKLRIGYFAQHQTGFTGAAIA